MPRGHGALPAGGHRGRRAPIGARDAHRRPRRRRARRRIGRPAARVGRRDVRRRSSGGARSRRRRRRSPRRRVPARSEALGADAAAVQVHGERGVRHDEQGGGPVRRGAEEKGGGMRRGGVLQRTPANRGARGDRGHRRQRRMGRSAEFLRPRVAEGAVRRRVRARGGWAEDRGRRERDESMDAPARVHRRLSVHRGRQPGHAREATGRRGRRRRVRVAAQPAAPVRRPAGPLLGPRAVHGPARRGQRVAGNLRHDDAPAHGRGG